MQVKILFPINSGALTYLVPEEMGPEVRVGARVIAPFKKSEKVGIIASIDRVSATTAFVRTRGKNGQGKSIALRPIKTVLDDEPFIPGNLLKLLEWVGQYYVSSSGAALKNAVPSAFFTGKRPGRPRISHDKTNMTRTIQRLTPEQGRSLDKIKSVDSGIFLLHGVTGSGKTEVYMRAIKDIPDDRGAIVLVPEIAVTAQMIDRFRSIFGDEAVFFHSGISVGERMIQWQKIRNGEVRVVLGVRSAVFAPFKKLGLIVVDEEHEASYKQFEGLRYSARDVALARGKIEGFKVVLGSATPSLETYYNAMNGRFQYLELPKRIDNKPMPHVEILDMTREPKKRWAFSDKLIQTLKENHSKGYQSLIMLNRRGYSPYLMCADCGHTYRCPACSISLTYHKDTKTMNCHYCGSYLYPGETCPKCNGVKIKYIGLGTQRLEEELGMLIPGLNLRRMDRDTTVRKLSHYRIVKEMEERKIDLLLGTQMVAKGHDLPAVRVSAVISADVALNLPDFRSAERAFQLFTQLAGRAGRGDVQGKVFIQTYEPGHYVFDYVREHDYKGFFKKEIGLRRELSYPPFSKLVRVIFNFKTKNSAKMNIGNISGLIKKSETSGVEVLGPAPAPIEKIRNLWRWHIILKGNNSKTLRIKALEILDVLKDVKGVRTDVDVNPVSML
jgi:primosomal protein N' (replication factor Y)